jgi:hypothetical protein
MTRAARESCASAAQVIDPSDQASPIWMESPSVVQKDDGQHPPNAAQDERGLDYLLTYF